MSKLTVLIGWDDREKTAYEVCKFSIEGRTKSEIRVVPLYHKELRRQGYFRRGWHTRATDGDRVDQVDDKPFSTEFSHTRFLVPELMKFRGWALFMDCDMLVRCDIKELFDLRDDRYAMMCVKNRHNPKNVKKMNGSPQQPYPRKNWSSVMLINCAHPSNRKLTKELVNTADGGWLHAMSWLQDHEIGELPKEFNWIDGVTPANCVPKIIHYSDGGPWELDYQDCKFADEWYDVYRKMNEDLPLPAASLKTINYEYL